MRLPDWWGWHTRRSTVGSTKWPNRPRARTTRPNRPVPTPSEVALRFVRMFERLSDSRQLFDLFGSGRMGQHLADAFVETYGDRAPKEVRLVKSWLDRAVAVLEATEYGTQAATPPFT